MSKIIQGDVNLKKLYLIKLPDILKDVSVGGDFSCSNNRLTSLSGAPQHVGGHFYCYSNSLTSLSGAPQHVVGDFYCNNNTVQFTVAQVRAVCDVSGEVFV